VLFEYDEEKSRSNLRKHRVSFETGQLVFDDPMHVTLQDREVDGEERWQTIGRVEGVLILLVAHTVEDEDGEVIRIISVRKATAHERRRYEEGPYR
jgi:uncharacterized DUF497 family protein